MANKIQFRRGNAADRPTLDVAEPGFDLDTNDLWLGTPAGNVKIYPPAALGSIGLSGSPLAGQIAVFDSPTDATGYADLTWEPVSGVLGVDGYLALAHQTASPVGAIGTGHLFVKASDAHLYFMDELGNETDLLAFGGGRLLVEPDPLTVSATDDYTIFARQTLNDPTAEVGTQTMTLIKGDISVVSQTGWDFVNLMDLQVDGVSKFLVANTGALTLSSNIFSGGSIFAGSGAARYVGWQSKSSMQSPVDGNITLLNSTFDNFGLLQFGGTTSSFPAIKRAGNALSVVFADDSGSTDLFVRNLFATSLVGVGAGSGSSRLYFQTVGDTYSALHFNSTINQLLLHTGATHGNQLVIGSSLHRDRDFDHGAPAEPTVFIHSSADPDTDNTQWGALYHDGLQFNLTTGTGVVEFGGVGGTFNHALQLDFEGNALGPVIQSRDTLWVVVNDSLSVTGQMNVTANMTIGSSQSYYWTVRTRLSSSADGLLQVSNYLGTVGATLDVTSPNTTVFRDLAGTGAGNAGLLIGGRLIFDADSDSNNYLTASDTATVMLYVSGVLSTFWAAGYQRFPHNNRLELGSTQNYWHVYNSAGVYEFWSTDVDGIGGNGLIFSVTDGGNDIVLGGGLALRNLERLSFDATSGADTGFYGNEANAEFRIQHNGVLWGYWSGGSGLNAADNKQISFGGNGATPDYWHVYNSTGLVYEFRSANVGGALPGIVWSVNDGTDDVSFSGDINLRENSRIYLDSDQTSNEWIDSNTAGIIRFVAGGQVQFTTATTGLVIPDGKRINIGSTGVDYILASAPGAVRIYIGGLWLFDITNTYGFRALNNTRISIGDAGNYWHVYNSTGTAYEFRSADVGGAVPGIVWSVADGTDDVDFKGIVRTPQLSFPTLTSDSFFSGNGSTSIRLWIRGIRTVDFTQQYTKLFDNVTLQWGDGADYSATYNVIGQRFEFSSANVDGVPTPGVVWYVDDATPNVHFTGNILVDGNQFNYGFLSLLDNKQLYFGNSSDYWHVYNPTGAAYEFHSANVDGVPNPGIVWSVADGTDDVDFGGHVKLKASGRLVFDSNLGADTYLWGANSAGGAIVVILNGLNWGQWSAFGTPYLRVNDNNRLAFGSGDGTNQDYWQVYNATAGALEFWSRNVDGVPNTGKVWSIDDGTDDIQFTGSLRLSVGQSIVLDADDDSSQSITATTSGNTTYYAGGFHIFNTAGATRLTISSFGLISSFPIRANDDIAFQFGSDTDYWAVYNSAGTAFELWSKDIDSGTVGDQNGRILWVDDGAPDLSLGGELFIQDGKGVSFDEFRIFRRPDASLGFSASGSAVGSIQSVGMILFNNKYLRLGANADYTFGYNGTLSQLELTASDIDGIGTDGLILTVDNGTQDVRFYGGITMDYVSSPFDAPIQLDRNILALDGTNNTHISAAQTVNVIRFTAASVAVAQFRPTVFELNVPIDMGNNAIMFGADYLAPLYWWQYNGTNALQLVSTNVDGLGGDGVVLSVADGTNDIVLSGGLSLNVGERITFDRDATANDYIIANADGDLGFYVGGVRIIRGFATLVNIDVQTQFITGARMSSTTSKLSFGAADDYWMTYNTSGQFEFWASDSDGAGLDGRVFLVEDGTDDVYFQGQIKLRNGQGLVLDTDQAAPGNRLVGLTTNLAALEIGSGSYYFGSTSAYMTDNISWGFGTGVDYYFKYDSTLTRFEMYSTSTATRLITITDGSTDMTFGGGLKINLGKQLVLNADGDGTALITAPNNNFVNFAVAGATRFQLLNNGPLVVDNNRMSFGTGGDYWHIYDATGTRYEFWTTDSDGAGTDRLLWWVNDDTDLLNVWKLSLASDGTYSNLQVAGGVLRIRGTGGTNNEDLVWDFETNPNEITLSSTTGVTGITSATVAWKGPVSTVYTSSFNVLYVTSYMGNPARSLIEFPAVNIMGFYGSSGNGVSFDLSTANRLRLRSRDTLGSADLALDVGAKLYFDAGSVTTDTYISAPIDNLLEVRVAATLVANFGANYLSLKDNIALLFGTGNDQRIQYYSATSRCEWNTSAGIAFYINDASLDVNFGGEVISSVFSSSTASPASTGIVRLAWGDSIYWRNTLDTADVGLTINASNRIECTGGFQAASSWLPSNGRLSWLSLFNIRSLIDGELRLNNYADTSGVTLNVNTADTLRLRNGVATGAAHLGLDGGGRLVFDADGSSNTYLTGSGGTQIDALVNSSQVMRLQVNTVRFFDSVGTYWGGGLDYWAVYNPAGSFQFWTTNGDGLGADALVYSIADGTNDVVFNGNIELNGNASNKLVFDAAFGSDTYLWNGNSGAGAILVVINGNDWGQWYPVGATYALRANDDRTFGFGTGYDYWQVYNSILQRFEFWTSNSDGLGLDGRVWSVSDGSTNVSFTGSLGLSTTQRLTLDNDGAANTYVTAPSAGAFSLYVGGAFVAAATPSFFQVIGDRRFYRGVAYWDIYNTAGTAYEFWTNDADGLGADGLVFDVQDGSDRVRFYGTIAADTIETSTAGGTLTLAGQGATNNESLSFDFETSPNVVGISSSGTAISFGSVSVSIGWGLTVGQAYPITWFGRAQMSSPNTENIQLLNSAASGFGLLQFGGTTSSFPALQRSTTTLLARLADNSGPAVLRSLSEVEINTAGTGTPNALTADETQKVFTNEGATALNAHELPAASPGITYTFVVQDADGIQVRAAAGDTIRIGANESATNGTIASTTIGEAVILVAINTTQWFAVSVINASNWTVT